MLIAWTRMTWDLPLTTAFKKNFKPFHGNLTSHNQWASLSYCKAVDADDESPLTVGSTGL